MLLHDQLPPAVIDLSLTWRPPAFAAAVVVVDALVWEGAEPSLADDVAAAFDDFGQHLARALVFRVLSDAADDQARVRAGAAGRGGAARRLNYG